MSGPLQFPNVSDKLSAPSKKSAFEKARLEAEEKRKREEAETAAVYKDFVASFDEAPPDTQSGSTGYGGRGGYGRGGFRGGPPPSGPGRRHFSGAPPPPSRAPAPPAPPPPRKRNLGDAFERGEEEGGIFGSAAAAGSLSEREKRKLKDGSSGLLAFENSGPKRRERYAADGDSGMYFPRITRVDRSV